MNSSIFIDINCDLGEGNSQQDCEKDALLMPYISSCNIACGGHAGNELTMRESLRNAKKNQLKIGAHPGYADKENFGRSSALLTEAQLQQIIISQIDYLLTIAKRENIRVQHIKFHGALYNDIENDPRLASEAAIIIQQFYPAMKVVVLADGELAAACKKLSLTFLSEGFIDRGYLPNGKLMPRSEKGALIKEQSACVNQAIALACDNHAIVSKVDTICLHGDNPHALPLIKKINEAFEESGIIIQ